MSETTTTARATDTGTRLSYVPVSRARLDRYGFLWNRRRGARDFGAALGALVIAGAQVITAMGATARAGQVTLFLCSESCPQPGSGQNRRSDDQRPVRQNEPPFVVCIISSTRGARPICAPACGTDMRCSNDLQMRIRAVGGSRSDAQSQAETVPTAVPGACHLPRESRVSRQCRRRMT